MKNFIALFLMLFSVYAHTEIVNLEDVSSHYSTQAKKSDSIFILLHGTRGHNNLELISSLRDSLDENSIDSLSINLSYGIKNRNSDFLACEIEHDHTVDESLKEIELWYRYAIDDGYKKIYLVGHSRGGQDIMNFYENLNTRYQALTDSIFLLAPISDNTSDHIFNYKKKGIDIKVINDNDKLNIDFLGCNNARVQGESFKSYYYNLDALSTIDALKVTRARVYVITASDDTIAPLTHSKVEKIVEDKTNIELHQVDGADHFFRDFYFDDLMDMITERIN
ncbi:MAG: alpha/beta hydrolase [Gammaproteobacteria bacterium]|jgi:hypothetical protein|nr:alpha/beta hydrolase [Gammaproteobacteria bacterium]MBT4462764.1 alpha/beta hydrolase [Gammaproteobacteria bacterium]MBT4654360.1 alpha/beta hydrolase [Gammaproteobacteria bacterium]MBT5117320.1 alpha/beta hydrolase [Gammaproteobacteria bacterium]MBT5761891.1 alpha/beta hydrolase [Gammaproteobacteria bacterium]